MMTVQQQQQQPPHLKVRKPFPLQFMHRRPSLPLRRESSVDLDAIASIVAGVSPTASVSGSQRNLQQQQQQQQREDEKHEDSDAD